MIMSENDAIKLSHNELLKDAVPTLAGNIGATLADPALDRFSEDDGQFLKFHGIYQQDDRDKRKTGKHYMFMVRGRIPGGVLSARQYLAFDALADKYANQTLRITSRQSFQFHGIVKTGLGKVMRGINDCLLDTLAACGDVNRNVMAPSTPATSRFGNEVLEDARRVSEALLPKTKAYHAIWVEGVQLNLEAEENKDFVDPLYGKTYLPRKFKSAFAIPPLNDTDVFTNDLGLIAIEEAGRLVGYNLVVGGGLGMSHGNKETFPRIGDLIGYFTPDKLVDVARSVLQVHRDFGDRTNRKHARLKYVLEEKGVAWFRQELEKRLGYSLSESRPFKFTKQGDLFGWYRQEDGRWFLGLYVETGRIKDREGFTLKAALKEIAEKYAPEVRLTPSQNLLLVNINEADRAGVNAILKSHGVPVDQQGSLLGRASMACPALPTCGLALAESERYLPALLGRIEGLLAEVGLAEQEIIIRMTGCPNGCARPYMAEIGFVGKAPGKYNLYLGGNEASTRLNKPYRESVKDADILNELRPLLSRYAKDRAAGERFGDWCERVVWKEQAAATV